jgi:hypothetical protein
VLGGGRLEGFRSGLLGFHFGMRCGVRLVGFGIEVGFVLVVFVEFVFFDVDYSVFDFDHLFRFVMVLNIFVEGAEASERRNVILFGAERGCFTLRLGNVLGESGGFFLGKFVMRGFEVIGQRFGFCFGFRFGFEVGDFRLGIIASGESLVRFVAGIRA